jgi:hypothetical protein
METQGLDRWLSITTDPLPRGVVGSAHHGRSEASHEHEHDDY